VWCVNVILNIYIYIYIYMRSIRHACTLLCNRFCLRDLERWYPCALGLCLPVYSQRTLCSVVEATVLAPGVVA